MAFGGTPHQDLTRLRIERAKALLAVETASVTDVCLEVGLFAEPAGCPPSAWRRQAEAPGGDASAGLA